MTTKTTLRVYLLLAGLGSSPVFAQADPWRLCPAPPMLDPQQRDHLQQLPVGSLFARAERLNSEAENHLYLRGNVELEQQGVWLSSLRADYWRDQDRLLLQQQVQLHSEGLLLQAEQAEYAPTEQRGRFDEVSFFIPGAHGYGTARTLWLRDPQRMEMAGLSYSTCPPEQQDWRLDARRLKLNQATNTGEAYHATLRFKGVPIFYSPYLNFPLEGRKSGLLPPSYGSSDRNGSDLTLPIYWNIAPNRDATFTPRHISKRGNMLGAEFRFLEARHAGEIYGSWLGSDQQTNEQRSELQLRHHARLTPHWRSELHYHGISDDDFFLDDLGQTQQSRSDSHLERRVDLRYADPQWQFLARAQGYQSLAADTPYQRLPQLQLHGSSPYRQQQPHYQLYAEAVSFSHTEDRVRGERIDIKPAISYPLRGNAWFLTPGLALRHTSYQLKNHTAEQNPQRTLAITTLDSGLFFERPIQLGRHGYLQTLEPRLFYLHVPYRRQDDLPLFDTAANTPSMASLFRDNRFSGGDRQGDAHQLSLGLTSRLLADEDGSERVRASIAQARYLRRPQLTLQPGEAAETRDYSDVFAELAVMPGGGLRLHLQEQWDPDSTQTQQRAAGVRYTPAHGQVLMANYRFYRPEAQRELELTALWPLTAQWRILVHHNRDIENRRTMLNLAGLEYESCCWTVRLLAQTRRDSISEPMHNAIMLTLELKGMASLGRSLEQSVGNDILGFY